FEVIVVDNGSSDGSVETIRNFQTPCLAGRQANPKFQTNSNPPAGGPKIKLIENKKNLGFAKAINQGAKEATGEYLLLLNSDTIVKKGALKKLIDYLEKNPDTAAVSPMLLNPDGTKQVEYYMKFPNLWQIIFYHNLLLRPLAMATPLRDLIISRVSSDNFEVDQLPGAALMTRRETFLKTGGLGEDYSFLFEDVDWCYQVKKENLGKLIVLANAKIVHLGGASWKKRLDKDRLGFYKQYFKSLLLFVKKHYPDQLDQYRRVMKITFLVNAIIHSVLFRFKKAKIQFLLSGQI
ncbi:glycosyltransferase family 2 protein, partial [Patescibacteria group bacterium]|nr:glycosyltransferase family 2 protein [Patescibacteria group bacterium]